MSFKYSTMLSDIMICGQITRVFLFVRCLFIFSGYEYFFVDNSLLDVYFFLLKYDTNKSDQNNVKKVLSHTLIETEVSNMIALHIPI